MQLMGGSSLLAKATTALQNAAAKADRAITEFKADFKCDPSKGTDGKLQSIVDLEVENSNEGGLRQRILPKKATREESEVEKSSDGGFRLRILPKKQQDLPSAVAVIEGDEGQDFWKRYISSIKSIKQELLDRDSDVRVSDDSVQSIDFMCSADSPKKDPIEEEDYKRAFSVVSIPASFLLRKLAAAAENGKSEKAMKNALQRNRSVDKEFTNVSGEWAGLASGLAMVRKLSHKDGKLRNGSLSGRGNQYALMFALFEVDTQLDEKEPAAFESDSPPKTIRVPQEIHGAPPDSFVAKLAELMGGLKSEQKMAEFWMEVIAELRRRWVAGEPIPRMPVDASPDLRYCSVHQHLQLINCCIARRKRRASTLASLAEAQSGVCQPANLDESRMIFLDSGALMLENGMAFPEPVRLYAKQKDGRFLLRFGADHPADELRMLETGEPVYSPVTQESPIFTEDSIREAEELVLRTGSVGAGCSHLLSDMQAFKAANPGCILEDFVRWYSPPDWREDPESGISFSENRAHEEAGSENPSMRGYLSARMQSKDNLWQELWLSARPIPAVQQSPLFDEELAGESTLDALENISPPDLFRQLFAAAFSVGYAIVQSSEASKQDPLRTCLQECSDLIVYTCGQGLSGTTLDIMCEAYEALEAAVYVPLEEDVQETQGRQWLSTLKSLRVIEKS